MVAGPAVVAVADTALDLIQARFDAHGLTLSASEDTGRFFGQCVTHRKRTLALDFDAGDDVMRLHAGDCGCLPGEVIRLLGLKRTVPNVPASIRTDRARRMLGVKTAFRELAGAGDGYTRMTLALEAAGANGSRSDPGGVRGEGRYQCPACGAKGDGHGLRVTRKDDGNPKFTCFAQDCPGDEILAALDLSWVDIGWKPDDAKVKKFMDSLPDGPFDQPAVKNDNQNWPTPEGIANIARTPLPASLGRRPAKLWMMVDATAEAYQVPRDLALLMILAILATSVGGRRRVRVAPDWTETLSIYATAAVPSGERKSPVMSVLSKPLIDMEGKLAAAAAPDVARQRALRDLRAAAVEKIKRKGDTSATGIADLEGAVRDLEGTVVPAIPRLLADDSTVEAMAKLMAEQGGRLGVLSAEGGLFANLAGRYSSGIPNLDLVLKAWSGDPVRVDRVSREPISLPEPVLSMGLAIQPAIVASLAEGRHFRGSGLLARFLYALPDSLVGSRRVVPQPLPEPVVRGYGESLELLTRVVFTGDMAEMKLTDQARDALNQFRDELEPRLHPDYGDLAPIADWANKLPGQLVRIAALLTLFDGPHADTVDAMIMGESIELAEYFISHARAAFDLMTGRRSPLEPARAVLRWIARKNLSTFNVRQAKRDLNGQEWVTDTDDIREALTDLEDLGWVRAAPTPERPRPGRPSEPYDVHPHAHGLMAKQKPTSGSHLHV